MNAKLRRAIALVVVPLLAMLGVTGISAAPTSLPAAEAKADKKFWDPGLIISDSVFYDFGTMTVDQIQRFLNFQVPKCAATTGPACLKDYVMDTPAKPGEDGKCDAMPAKTAQTAAMIIFDIAHACGINPRVLLVTLQKEQGLVQATKPTSYMYRAALGYGCPDSDPAICGKVWSGLFNQLYKGAGQFQWYGDPRGSFTYLKVGKTVAIRYNPDSTCGTKSVLIKSQATAALYYYTPYTPNDAALNNLYGTGNSCSAYGNRNFWRFYNDWFGSTIGGGFLVQANGTDPYLIVDTTKYPITDPALVNALAPLGPLGTISSDYLNSFTDGAEMTRFVGGYGGPYFVDGGQKYRFLPSTKLLPQDYCNAAAIYGLDCNSGPALSNYQLSALPTSGVLTPLVAGDTTGKAKDQYLITSGVKHEILDLESVGAANITLPTLSPVGIQAFNYIPFGSPVARDGSLFKNRADGTSGVYVGGQYYQIDPATLKDFDFSKWFIASTGSLGADSIHAIDSGIQIKSIIGDQDGHYYLLTQDGKRLIDDATQISPTAPILPAAVLNRIPTVGQTIKGPVFVKGASSKTVYYVDNALRRPTLSAADRARLLPSMTNGEVLTVADSALNQIALGATILGPGTVVNVAKSTQSYLVDGLGRALQLPSDQHRSLVGLPKSKSVTADDLRGYLKTKKIDGIKVTCGTETFITLDGALHPIDPAFLSAYPSKPVTLDDLTCNTLKFSTVELGRFFTTKAKTIYVASAGTKRVVATKKQYALLRGSTPNALPVSDYFASLLPTGKPIPAKQVTPISTGSGSTPSPTPSATPTKTPTASPSPTPTKTPTASPTPTPTKTPAPVYYTVVKGDTLTAIATKFKTTVTAIERANNLANVNSIYVGQKLLIP